MSKIKWTVPMYTREFLACAGYEQVLAVVCCQCRVIWEMNSPSCPASEQEAIELARDHYRYKMTSAGPVCDKCQEESARETRRGTEKW